MAQWAYKVVYIDHRGQISSEGLQTLIGNERQSTFIRRYMNTLGKEGWELVTIQPLTAHSAYYTFKRPAQEGDFAEEVYPPPRAHPRKVWLLLAPPSKRHSQMALLKKQAAKGIPCAGVL